MERYNDRNGTWQGGIKWQGRGGVRRQGGFIWVGKRKAGKNQHKHFHYFSITVNPEAAAEVSFLLRSGSAWLERHLQDGICLICGETDFLFFEYDHVIGRKRSKTVITLCANDHRLKTNGRLWRLEARLEEWLGGHPSKNS